MSKANTTTSKTVDAITHEEATRKNIPTAEYQSMVQEEDAAYRKVVFERRNKDLDPQLVWRGKDVADWSDLVVQAPPLYIQEKVHPKVLIDDLMRQTKEKDFGQGKISADLFADFNGIPHGVDKTEFYKHDQHWSNRMILGDSLQVMASLAEREGLRGQVQCIYFDPPYGIKFNSNFQWSTTTRDVKDGKADHITREPEQVKAFRDTWKDGIHSYLTYLRERLTVARDLLKDSGSIFVQIGDENVHRVRTVIDEVFGSENFISCINFLTTGGFESGKLANITDHILWFAKNADSTKYRQLWEAFGFSRQEMSYRWIKEVPGVARSLKSDENFSTHLAANSRLFKPDNLISQGAANEDQIFRINGRSFRPAPNSHWKASFPIGMTRLFRSDRIYTAANSIRYIREITDFPVKARSNFWDDTATGQFTDSKIYVVQTNVKVVERCILMASDPGDLVLDPTCGSGTTAAVAEQWGRRWITIDTSRVALALARARIMGSRYPYYLMVDSKEGQIKEAEITGTAPSTLPTYDSIRHGFVHDRVPHITLKSIANNKEIDVIWDKWQQKLEPLRIELNNALHKTWEEWEVPKDADERWTDTAKDIHTKCWQARIARQKEIDASIAAKAEYEYLYDKPFEDKKRVRVAGPFTVESISPHRVLGLDENDELIDPARTQGGEDYKSFAEMVLENLKTAGVQQAHKEDKVDFVSLAPWPGTLICAEGRYLEGNTEKRAAIFIGPEFGTVLRGDLVEAAREAADAEFDVLVACAFSYEAHTTEFNKLGRITVLKARMNADLHMADDLKNTGKGNLFVIFGEPDIDILDETGESLKKQVGNKELIVVPEGRKMTIKINGVDVFHPSTGEVRSDGAEGIACWFIDTDYNSESFFVRHAYFLGANDPYGALKTSLKAEIDREAWESLNSAVSRPFPKPASGRIAIKVINHLGDEVMKVFKID